MDRSISQRCRVSTSARSLAAMKTWQLISIVLSSLVAGMFHGPWIALSRSMKTFTPEVFLAIVDRMNRNMAPVMTVLMPATLLSIIPVLLISYHQPTFWLNAAAFLLFIVALARHSLHRSSYR